MNTFLSQMKQRLKRILWVLFFIQFLYNPAKASVQQTNDSLIKGTVMTETSEPIANASISTGYSNAVSNKDGSFSLWIKTDRQTILTVTHIGYEPATIKMDIIPNAPLVIVLVKGTMQLETVTVSTGYQKVSKEKIVGAVTVIGNEVLNQQAGTNILQRLKGVTSGLIFNVGKADSKGNPNELTIRGMSTINGPVRPLIVLDNFIYEGDINNINPNDVENITVLKDAAATSLWGARAGNGVIVITTKKAAYNQKIRISASGTWIVTNKPNVYYPSRISVRDFIQTEQFLFNKGFFDNQINNTVDRPALSPAVEVFLKTRDGTITSADSAAQIEALMAIDTRDQFDRYFYQRGLTQQYNTSVSGGGKNYNWLLSASMDRNSYALKNTFDKANFHVGNSFRPVKNLSVNLNLFYTASKSTSGIIADNSIYGRTIPYLQFADAAGNALPIDRYRNGFTDTAGKGLLLDWKLYPLEDYKHDRTITRLQELIAGIDVTYQIVQPLGFTVSYQYQKQQTNADHIADVNSFYTRNLINKFSQVNYSNNTVSYIVPLGGILDKYNSELGSQNLRGQFNFNKIFSDHTITAIAGSEIRELVSKGTGVRYFGYQEDPLAYTTVANNVYSPTIIPGYPELAGAAPSFNPTINNRFVSFYGNGSYTYKNRYTAYGSFRKDASNTFGLSTNDKWNPLWSAGLKWDISAESFYRSNILPLLKLRTSYGYSGNVDVTKTPLPISGTGLRDATSGFPIMTINNPANPLLRWERIRQINIGIDFGFKDETVSGSIDYYKKKGTDLYGPTLFDYTAFPNSSIVEKNVAAMAGDGIDGLIRTTNLKRALSWFTTLLFNYSISKTKSYYMNEGTAIVSLLAGGSGITPVPGYPLYGISAYKWGGLDNAGDPQGYLNGQKSKDYNAMLSEVYEKGLKSGSVVFIGPATPKYFGSLINELYWKGFTFSANISYQFGYYFRKIPFTSDGLINRGISPADFESRWMKPGDEAHTNIPALVYTNYPQFNARDNFYSASEVNVLKGDHIRLQYLNAGYTFKKIPEFESVQLSLNAANLGILYRFNKEKIDPDYPFTIPPSPAFSGTLKIIF